MGTLVIKINNELKEPVSNVLTGSFCFKGALKDREGLSNLLAFIEANDADGKAAHPCGPCQCVVICQKILTVIIFPRTSNNKNQASVLKPHSFRFFYTFLRFKKTFLTTSNYPAYKPCSKSIH